MNIESTSTAVTSKTSKSVDVSASSSNPISSNQDATSSTSFKEELESVKKQDAKAAEAENTKALQDAKTAEENKIIDSESEANNTQNGQIKSEQALSEQLAKDKLALDKKNELNKSDKSDKSEDLDPIQDLNSKIATICNIKNNPTEKITGKAGEVNQKNDYCRVMTMDSKDITFFVGLVENQQMTAQSVQGSTANNALMPTFTEIKSEATQQTVQVSATLMDALNESMKTNKPFRIDFDSDVAVIMKVDKDGVLSANFIPGSAAVEAYLKNNIAGLRQNFENQNLAYNELSYSKQQKQEQEDKKQSKNKENEDE